MDARRGFLVSMQDTSWREDSIRIDKLLTLLRRRTEQQFSVTIIDVEYLKDGIILHT